MPADSSRPSTISASVRVAYVPIGINRSMSTGMISTAARESYAATGTLRMRIENHRSPWLLVEVEITDEVAKHRHVLAHRGPRIRAAVSRRVEPLPSDEVVLDELGVGVETQGLVVDVAPARIWRDDHCWDPEAVSLAVDDGWDDMVVETAPVIPGEEDGR